MESDYQDRFGGVSRLLGAAALERLRAAHVCVVGVGGVGSWTVEALARSGVGALTLIDLDDVCVTNVNRQLHALDGQIGRPKIEVLAERVRLINPACNVTTVHAFSTEGTVKELLASGYDCVVDAVDRMSNKVHLIGEAKRRGMGCVTVGSAGGRRDIARMRIGDLGQAFSDELLRQVRKKLRRDYGFEHGEDVIFGVRCVWSIEAPVYPQADGTCSAERAPGENLRIDCATGFGSGVWLTGAFGLAAAQEVVDVLLARK
ncbi:MAG TPA: tRNA threonylcarbamoyladenosine dehydratase [Rariglobus sp.]|jgi:tRNA A37 threonylcarbamoyladenosine dehydratase|nr:tRNA threonylcarbamoyladenosine dehydratase [Rariglobus sp.]